ncbi:uncharacterized protein LOC123003560 [Tribolium madens]|uniref:uncharacterized protein LOC123003560 n=1 Tax=Tribolium madens TaxID=41895 RepID=UPI001CF75626|nr:uncharacterized protein LOC123003560 [Tribolium madens]
MKLSFVCFVLIAILQCCCTEILTNETSWRHFIEHSPLVDALKPKNDTEVTPPVTSRLFNTNNFHLIGNNDAQPQPFYQKWIISPIVQFISKFSKPLAFTFQKIVNVVETIGRKLWGILSSFLFGNKPMLEISRRKRQANLGFSPLLNLANPLKTVLKTILALAPDFTQRFPTVLARLETLNGGFDTGFFILDTVVKYIGFWITKILPRLSFLVDIFTLVWDGLMEFRPWFEKILTHIFTVGKTVKYTDTVSKNEISPMKPEVF